MTHIFKVNLRMSILHRSRESKSNTIVNSYLPVSQILTTIDSDQTKWQKYIETIENLFKRRSLPDFALYDDIRYLKMNRNTYKYENFKNFVSSVSYSFKTSGFTLTDHKPLIHHGIMSWNVLHHYSYNGSNDYIDSNVIRYFNVPVLTERARYSLISSQIHEYILNDETQCISLQECEFAIYKSLVEKLGKEKYTCRFIPHRIAYDNHGLYIESYGCAIILKNTNPSCTHVNPVVKNRYNQESGYKYVICVQNGILYSSIHFPKYGGKCDYVYWENYAYTDIEFILSKMENINEGYLIGDLNMSKNTLEVILKSFTKYKFTILDNRGVDYIIKVERI